MHTHIHIITYKLKSTIYNLEIYITETDMILIHSKNYKCIYMYRPIDLVFHKNVAHERQSYFTYILKYEK